MSACRPGIRWLTLPKSVEPAELFAARVGADGAADGFAGLGEGGDECIVGVEGLEDVPGHSDLDGRAGGRRRAFEAGANASPQVFEVVHVDGSQVVRGLSTFWNNVRGLAAIHDDPMYLLVLAERLAQQSDVGVAGDDGVQGIEPELGCS